MKDRNDTLLRKHRQAVQCSIPTPLGLLGDLPRECAGPRHNGTRLLVHRGIAGTSARGLGAAHAAFRLPNELDQVVDFLAVVDFVGDFGQGMRHGQMRLEQQPEGSV